MYMIYTVNKYIEISVRWGILACKVTLQTVELTNQAEAVGGSLAPLMFRLV